MMLLLLMIANSLLMTIGAGTEDVGFAKIYSKIGVKVVAIAAVV